MGIMAGIKWLLTAKDHGWLGCLTSICSALAIVNLRLRGAEVGHNLSVVGGIRFHLHRTARVLIGNHCRINSGFYTNPVGGFRRMNIWVGPRAILRIGNRVGMSNSTLVCCHSVTIEDEVRIGGDSKIYDTDFHSLNPELRLRSPDPDVRTGPIVIKQRAFIGAHVIILKGVTIGEEAVIGAGSVVTRDVPSGEVWAGNPARYVKRTYEKCS